jgi:sugar O-acyltransferase (sialic acid O-acetyltransferase NeuD family)
MMSGKRLVIVGAGAFGREIMCWADIAVGAVWSHISWVDDAQDVLQNYNYPWPCLGSLAAYVPDASDVCVVAAGEPAAKKTIAAELESRGCCFATLVHPTAVIARTAHIGDGSICCPLSFVSADARLGRFVTVNGLSSVGHDVVVGDFSTLSAHVDLTGHVKVGEGAFFGSGARVVPRISIGSNARIGAGATVVRNVAEGVTMFAVPAKRL